MTLPHEIFKCADGRWFKKDKVNFSCPEETLAPDRGRSLISSGLYEENGCTSFHRFWILKYEIRKSMEAESRKS